VNKTRFISQLILVAILALVTAFLFQQFVFEENHLPFLLSEIVLFIVSAFVVHQIAINAAKSDNKYAFSRITMANTFAKLFLVVGMVVIYKEVLKPESINFVFPFIIIYLMFTIFETKFLMKLARL